VFTKEQIKDLKEAKAINSFPESEKIFELATELKLHYAVVKFWFVHRNQEELKLERHIQRRIESNPRPLNVSICLSV
jgi:hypothetical protein